MREVEHGLHRALERLVRGMIDLVHTPPAGDDEMPKRLKAWVTPVLEAVREGLMELEADQPHDDRGYEASEAALERALRGAWEVIDECRTVRGRTRASRPST
jgi:hypothetical protein